MNDQILKLIESGNYLKAFEMIDKLEDDDPKKYNFLGMIYFNQGKLNEAKEAFEKGLKYNPIDSDLLFNYGYVLKQFGNDKEAWRYLMRIHDKDWAVYDLLGDTQFNQGNIPMALKYYSKAAQITDNEEMKKKFLEMYKKEKKDTKIAFLCLPELDNFLKDIVETLSFVYDTKLVVTTDGKTIDEAVKWADIVWIEWANEMAVFVTKQVPEIESKKVICRLHSYEVFTNLPEQINWSKIHTLIFVAKHIKELFHELHPSVDTKELDEIVISNGVNLEKFKFLSHIPGYNLAVVAHINYKKDPTMWIQLIAKLKEIDNRYKLHIAGDFQDLRYKVYFEHAIKELKLNENVVLHGWINNVDKFLEDKNYVISTSIHESFGYNIGEALARGIKAVILNYRGAKEQWPNDLLFNTLDEALESIIVSEKYDSERYRAFVEDNCSLEKQILEISCMLKNEFNSKERKGINVTPVVLDGPVLDLSKHSIDLDMKRYEEQLEAILNEMRARVQKIKPEELIGNIIPLMIDFLERFYDKGMPYQKTPYYLFLSDMYNKGLYLSPPETIIAKFINLFEDINQSRKIFKPIVALANDGNLYAYDSIKRSRIKVPETYKFLIASGRHRVAIAHYLGFDSVPTYVLLNKF